MLPPLLKEQGLLAAIKTELAGFLKKILPLKAEEIGAGLEQPRRQEHGHLALPIFALAKKLEVKPQNEAQHLSHKINQNLPAFLKPCSALSGFVNFQFQETYIQKKLELLFLKKQLACFSYKKKEHWLMDFASPNVAKRMNIGHLRATVLGQALANLAKTFGLKVTALNHLGDWGSQFGKLLWAYQKWGKEYDFKNQAFSSLIELYVRFHQEAEGDEKNLQEARDLFQQLEAGDLKLKKLWECFVRLSLENYEPYWKILNVQHDLVQGESFYIDFLDDLKNRLREKNLLKKSEGAELVFLNEDSGQKSGQGYSQGLAPCLISKRDGASTYASRDLASLIYRFEHLAVDKNIYITGSDQKLHFKQIFQVAGQLNPKWQAYSLHLNFGMYRFKGKGKMSSRQGQAVYLKDILNQAFQRVKKIIEERNPGLKNKQKIAWQVGVGALIFNDLMNDRVKDVDFDWSKVLDFEGQSGPFVQYSLVRSQSLLKKFKGEWPKGFSKPLESAEEKQLAWHLLCFETAVFQSFKNFKPHILARYLLDLAKEFNRFYTAQKILGQPRESDLLILTEMSRRTLSKGLKILNIPRPEAM